MKTAYSVFREKISAYRSTDKARDWLEKNLVRVKALFENYSLRDFIFEPFKGVFASSAKTVDKNIYSLITQVAVINAVLAGLPGKMGVGVTVSIALEAWMAYSIAKHVGISIKGPNDIWKFMGVLAGSLIIILYLFRILLGFGFSVSSFILPGINPMILAELFVTDLVGILFWVGFEEVKNGSNFRIPRRMISASFKQASSLFKHQFNLLKNSLSPTNIKTVGNRLITFFKGEFPVDTKSINGDLFPTIAMAYLLAGQTEKLQGPLGEAFLEAIRLRWSAQLGPDASAEEIRALFANYDPDQLAGAIITIKGKMFEILVFDAENTDGDHVYSKMHTDESFPGSDLVMHNELTGETIEFSLKAVSAQNVDVIETALAKYPNVLIITTDEVAALYENDPRVVGSGFTNHELRQVTEENMEQLLGNIEVGAQSVVIAGVEVGFVTALWPFVAAYLRGRISYEKLKTAFEHVLGDTGVKLVSRISYATVFGPVFAWYLLARGVKGIVCAAEPGSTYKMEVNQPILASNSKLSSQTG